MGGPSRRDLRTFLALGAASAYAVLSLAGWSQQLMAGDKFTKSVRMILAHRAGFHCSDPTCRAPTSGPTENDEIGTVDIGMAAHITAAAVGGPRYDPNLTPAERKGPSNGIWMCYTH